MKMPNRFYVFFAGLSGICWGTYGVFSRILSDYRLDSATISLIVPLSYCIFFLVRYLFSANKKTGLTPKLFLVLVGFGSFSALFNYASVRAYALLPIGIVSTVIYCNLFLLMVFTRLLLKTPITKEKVLSAAVAVGGIGLMVNVFAGGGFHLSGLAFSFLAMIAWACAVTLEKFLLEKGADTNIIMIGNGLIAVGVLSLTVSPGEICANIFESVALSNGYVLLPLVCFAVVTSMLSYFFYITALGKMDAAYCQLGFLFDPLTSTILGLIVFHQSLTLSQIVGMILILGVVTRLQWQELKKPTSP